MFLQNVGYRWTSVEAAAASGAIFRASAQNAETALRREAPTPAVCLFDPQLYLLDCGVDDPADYSKLLAKLATYPWFGLPVDDFRSSEQTVRDWTKAIQENISDIWGRRRNPRGEWSACVDACVRYQESFGCTAIVLPATLIVESSDNIDEDMARLDEAVEVARRITARPLIASLALDERALERLIPTESHLLDALVDGLSARNGVEGAYVTVALSLGSASDRTTRRRVAGSMLRLSRLLSTFGKRVYVNFVELLGLVAQSVGAVGYGSGYGAKERRLCLADYRDNTRGMAFPKLLSWAAGMDFRVADLDTIAARGMMPWLLTFLERDRTEAASGLFDALAQQRPTRTVVDWEDRQNNVGAAELHYLQAMVMHGDRAWTSDEMSRWLMASEAAWNYLAGRFEEEPLRTHGGHLGAWRAALEDVLRENLRH